MSSPVTSRPGKGPSQEYLLLDYLNRLSQNREGRIGLHVHLSRLKPYNRKEHHTRVAAATFDSLIQVYEGQTFMLSNSDIFLTCKGAPPAEIDSTIAKVRFLFSDDPLGQGDTEEDIARFCTRFNLETEYDEMVKSVQTMHRERERRMRQDATLGLPDTVVKKGGRKPIDPEQLDRLETFLVRADLSNLMRRQSIVAIPMGGQPQTIFQELYISIPDLQQTVTPDVDLMASPWLFQRLTRVLDNRMLAMLMRNDDSSIASSFSINLNVLTVLTPAFLRFDSSLKALARGTMAVELQMVDVFADLTAFFFVRDFLRERGYRVCLDGLTHLTLQFVDRERLGFDLLKMIWAPEMADDLTGKRQDELKAHVNRASRARIILCRCDSQEAIRFGQSLGINMFQGRYIEKLLSKDRMV
jgi:EAL domain-containing protein (putative c-di-GMP-specific phosphodiesterase class I)